MPERVLAFPFQVLFYCRVAFSSRLYQFEDSHLLQRSGAIWSRCWDWHNSAPAYSAAFDSPDKSAKAREFRSWWKSPLSYSQLCGRTSRTCQKQDCLLIIVNITLLCTILSSDCHSQDCFSPISTTPATSASDGRKFVPQDSQSDKQANISLFLLELIKFETQAGMVGCNCSNFTLSCAALDKTLQSI